MTYHYSEPRGKGAAERFRNPRQNAAISLLVAAEDDVITQYVRHRLREYVKGGGLLNELAESVGMPPSTPSQVLSGKLGVGNVNRPRFAKAFGMNHVELAAEAQRWADLSEGTRTLPTRAQLFSKARGKQHELGMSAALAQGITPLTVARGNQLTAGVANASTWHRLRWLKLYMALAEAFDEELPARPSDHVEKVEHPAPKRASKSR